MKIIIAIDSFKGSLSSIEAGTIIKEAILSVTDADIIVRPLADGGEGTTEALIEGMNGKSVSLTVTGPVDEPVTASYGLLGDKRAVIEMASAAGLPQVPVGLRNPLHTTSYGVGEMIKDAIYKGCREFIIGLGGSATNDAGLGMLSALGFVFLDADKKPVTLDGKGLERVVHISSEGALPELIECRFRIACDVNNPLFGTNGAAYIYGPQKGATPKIVERLDAGLKSFGTVTCAKLGLPEALMDTPGCGAAGGLGFAFLAYLNGTLEPGIGIILEAAGIKEDVKSSDMVITGEGRLDEQTAMGKAPIGVAKLAKTYGNVVLAFSGCATQDAVKCNEAGIDAYFPIMHMPMSTEEAIDPGMAAYQLKNTVVQVFRMIMIAGTLLGDKINMVSDE